MKNKKLHALSFIEFGFIIFVLFFVYTFVVKQMLADLAFTDFKKAAAMVYTDITSVSNGVMAKSGFVNLFDNEYDIINLFIKNLAVEKVCPDAKKDVCWSNLWLWSTLVKPGIQLQNGQYLVAELKSSSCTSNINIPNTCAVLYIDTNGAKAPNLIGRDIIKVYITKDGLRPAGVKEDVVDAPNTCDMVNKFSWACSARIIGVK